MNADMSRRPVRCPRCDSETTGMRKDMVCIIDEFPAPKPAKEVSPTAGSCEVNTEAWVKYLPCEHVVPPEEHNDVVKPTITLGDN